jgi:protein TonB
MTHPTNVIRLDEFVGPPARQHGDGAPVAAPTRLGIAAAPPRDTDRPPPDNVIAFVRPAEASGDEDQPTVLVLSSTGPLASASIPLERPAWIFGLLIVSAVVHAGALAMLNRPPQPMASIGIEAISVELVLGDATPVAPPVAPPDTRETAPTPSDPIPEQTAAAPPEAKIEPSPPAEPEPPPTVAASEPPPTTVPPETPPTAVAIEPSLPDPTIAAIPPQQQALRPPEKPIEAAKPPEHKPIQSPRKPAEAPSKREHGKPATDARPSNRRAPAHAAAAPSGAGPGRSDAETNYRGIAASHLARFKQFPAEARSRGEQGNSVVSFTIDGSGRVSRVSLVRGTGIASLDQESQAMVRRASPFPPPPGGRPVSITAPVSFHLR